jgi:hypothetical protein
MTTKRWGIAFIALAVVLALAGLALLNAPGDGNSTRTPLPMEEHDGVHYEHTRSPVPLAMAMVGNVVPKVPGDCGKKCQKHLNAVDHRRHIRTPVPLSLAERKEGRRSFEDAWNAYSVTGALLYSITFKLQWGWNGGTPGQFDFSITGRDFWPANQWWNQWKLVRWHPPTKGSGGNSSYRYKFQRETADTESCFAFSVAGCWFHQSPWIQETWRTDGSNDADMGA